METARLFIAVPVSEPVRQAAAALIGELKPCGADCKWVAPANLHLTLRFLGQTPVAELDAFGSLIIQAARRPPFDIAFEGFGVFPSWDAPRVVWVGVTRGAAELSQLAAALGPGEEGRPFSPHLTIGRVRSRRQADRLRQAAARASFPALTQAVDRLVLYESRLTPEGSIYMARREALLGA